MKEGLTTAKAVADPHDWMDVKMEVVIDGTRTVLYKVAGTGGICKKCHSFATLPNERWNPYDPERYPCK